MKFQVFQWLIGATDGHANTSPYLFRLAAVIGSHHFMTSFRHFRSLAVREYTSAISNWQWGLTHPKAKKTAIDKIYPRHFLATAKVLKFPEVQMHEILSDFARMIPAALDNVKTSLPTDFPENVVTAVETNVLRLHGRLSREYGIK